MAKVGHREEVWPLKVDAAKDQGRADMSLIPVKASPMILFWQVTHHHPFNGRKTKRHLKRWLFSSVNAVTTRDSLPVAYLWSSSVEEIIPAHTQQIILI